MRAVRALWATLIGCGACLPGSGCGDRDAAPTSPAKSSASPRWVHRYVPKGMEHWAYTEEIKNAARRTRRQDDLAEVEEGLDDADDEKPAS